MKVGLCVLHYGIEYLAWAVRALNDVVDHFIFLYTPIPSFGHQATTPCPHSRDQLHHEAFRWAKKPITWVDGNWPSESAHREAAYPIAKQLGATQILVFDSDEIYDPEAARQALQTSEAYSQGIIRLRFIHFFRSLRWVCKDPCMPVRILNLDVDGRPKPGEQYLSPQLHPVFHTGYAITFPTCLYKISIHGHLAEFKPNWFNEKFAPFHPGMKDVHPCNGYDPSTQKYFWEPEPIDQETQMVIERQLGDHPFWNQEYIS
jgi:hypothetical protein